MSKASLIAHLSVLLNLRVIYDASRQSLAFCYTTLSRCFMGVWGCLELSARFFSAVSPHTFLTPPPKPGFYINHYNVYFKFQKHSWVLFPLRARCFGVLCDYK